MKKTLAVLLSVLMLFSCFTFLASAEGETEEISGTVYTEDGGFQTISNKIYVVPEGATLTVPAGKTLYLAGSATLRVYGKLQVNGNIITYANSAIEVYGTSYGMGNISGEGSAKAAITFPALADAGLAGKINVSYAVGANAYADIVAADEVTALQWTNVPDAGATVMVDLNKYLFVRAAIIEPDAYDRYDDGKMKVRLNSVGFTYAQGVHSTELGTAGTISYSTWTSDADFYNTFSVYLPKGEGYEVVGRNGEVWENGSTLKLKYGQPFSFRVELDEEYDMCKDSFEVYIYDGYGWLALAQTTDESLINFKAEPDQYGYYNIPEVKGDLHVQVVGVIKNETITLVGDLLETIRNVFNMIKEFFENFLALFNFNK